MNAAAVSLNRDGCDLGLYGDGVYLAVAGQDSRKLGVPNLADILYAYGELRVLVHEPSLVERGLFGETLIETLELTDEEDFFEAMENSDCVIRFKTILLMEDNRDEKYETRKIGCVSADKTSLQPKIGFMPQIGCSLRKSQNLPCRRRSLSPACRNRRTARDAKFMHVKKTLKPELSKQEKK